MSQAGGSRRRGEWEGSRLEFSDICHDQPCQGLERSSRLRVTDRVIQACFGDAVRRRRLARDCFGLSLLQVLKIRPVGRALVRHCTRSACERSITLELPGPPPTRGISSDLAAMAARVSVDRQDPRGRPQHYGFFAGEIGRPAVGSWRGCRIWQRLDSARLESSPVWEFDIQTT